jgi:peroxiredoxin
MKIEISFPAALIIINSLIAGCHASVVKSGLPSVANDTTHAMLHPDANTIYLDSLGHKIPTQQFMDSMKSGRYIFQPDMKNGKVLSIRLKATQQKVAMGSMAPEFSGTTLDGHAIDLKSLKGKTVILNFWFTSCAPCISEMPGLNTLVNKYKNDSSVVFLAVTYNSADQVKAFLKTKAFNFNILTGRHDIIQQYGISGYPTSLVIDKTGSVAFSLTTYDGTNVEQLDGIIGALKNS